ncbi:lycopene beta-cyclase CrtY [Ramlibacter tataouinensis]|uniref:Candidate Lycopene cyclase n=1 Tax=Ramlibacter tataouinensis (strain ATCC BAA-407 / DSM 14655 / LMG 21543 / TTB310) TaxID=365046 RepID=F5XXQ0_RAMTT|nr:lycopene beta-cyclase CrtY [Ramlibacter tataouinensis]AEG91853.1 candidate Lycopene cyclase [Ramlibacter tataouinensis TTB310]
MHRHSDGAHDADLVLAGGGLANGLIAWWLRHRRPELRVLLLEAGPALGGNHTWSFHPTDLAPDQQRMLDPLVGWRWDRHEVRFPGLARQLSGGYASIASERFDAVLRGALGDAVRLDTAVAEVGPGHVRLSDGSWLRAGAVIDGRGLPPDAPLELGFQKFLGQVLRLQAPHGLAGPILMDATVPQHDGYRFVYTLPLDERTVLVEDTFYADGDAVDEAALRRNLAAYAQAQGWRPAGVLREERGVLPITLDGDPQALWSRAGGVPRSGLAAGLFHPTTGYSLPEAVRLAERVAGLPDLSAGALFQAVRAHAMERWRDQAFFRLLNRMLFRAAAPAQRWRVMQRFYGLPEPLIARFYGSRLTAWDRLRIVSGKPPVPLAAAVRAALGRPAGGRAQEVIQ